MSAGRTLPGVYAMCITPFRKDGKLDEGALREHLRFLIARGVGVFLASVGTGEATLLSDEELVRVYEVGVAEVKGKSPVFAAGIGFGHTRAVIRRANAAAAAGVDGVYLYGPKIGEANKPSNQEIEAFFHDVLRAVKAPAWLANNTSTTNYEIPHSIFGNLLKAYPEKILGLVNAHTDPNYMPGFFATAGKKPAFVAMMPNLPATIALGGHGVLAPDPNIIPRLSATTHGAFAKGDAAKALPQFAKILRLGAALAKYRNPRSQKAALNIMGLPGGYPRSPMQPLDDAAHKEIKRALDELEIAKFEGIG